MSPVSTEATTRMRAVGLFAAIAVISAGCTTAGSPSLEAVPSVRATATAEPTPKAAAGLLLFTRYNLRLEEDEIFVIGADSSGERQLLEGLHDCPRWSPDGEWISMTGATAPAFVRPDGSGFRELVSPDGHLILGCGGWSSDGTRYYSESWDDADPSRTGIYSFNVADGGDLRRVTMPPNGAWDSPIDVSPDGQWLAFNRDDSLMIVRVDGIGERLLAKGFTGADWSPDGTMILASANGALHLISVETGAASEITILSPDFTATEIWARWSPDGTHIAFSMKSPGPYADIYTMRIDGTDLHRVTHSPASSNLIYSWSE